MVLNQENRRVEKQFNALSLDEHVWPVSGLQSVGEAPNWQPFWIDQDSHENSVNSTSGWAR